MRKFREKNVKISGKRNAKNFATKYGIILVPKSGFFVQKLFLKTQHEIYCEKNKNNSEYLKITIWLRVQ